MNIKSRLLIVVSVLAAQTILPARSADDLVAHWTFDENTGSAIGNWQGSLVEYAKLGINSKVGVGGYQQNTGTGYLQTDCPGISGSAPRSVSIWFYATYGDDGETLFGWGENTNTQRYDFRITNSGPRIEIQGSGHTFPYSGPLRDFKWHHAILSFAGGSLSQHTLYVDGKNIGTSAGASGTVNTSSSTNLRIGTGVLRSSGARDYEGYIDDVGIYNSALNQEDVTIIYGLSQFDLDLSQAQLARNLWQGDFGDHAILKDRKWWKVSGLPGKAGEFGGDTNLNSAFIVINSAGEGIANSAYLPNPVLNLTDIKPDPNRPNTLYGIDYVPETLGPCRLVKIDATTAAVVSSIEIVANATDFDIDASDDRLYIASPSSTGAMIVDLAAFSVAGKFPSTTASTWVEADGTGHLLLGESPANSAYINIWNISNQKRISTGIDSGDMETSFNGERLYRRGTSTSIVAFSLADPVSPTYLGSANTPYAKARMKLLLSNNGTRVAYNTVVLDQDLNFVSTLPESVRSLSPDGVLAIGLEHIRFTSTGLKIATLPQRGDVSAFSQDGKYLLFFDAVRGEMKSLEIAPVTAPFESSPLAGEILDHAPASLKWPVIEGASSYTITISGGPDGTRVAEGVSTNSLFLDPPLASGWSYSWSVAAHTGDGVVQRDPISFTVRFERASSVEIGNPGSLNPGSIYSVSFSNHRMIVNSSIYPVGAHLFSFDYQNAETSFLQILNIGPQDGLGEQTGFLMGQPVIGATTATGGTTRSGTVLRYKPSGAFLDDYTRLSAPDGLEDEWFGRSLATDGDTMLSGNPSLYESGNVIAFLASGDSTASAQILTSNTPRIRDYFGTSIALEGNTALITAPGSTADTVNSPTLFVFERDPADGQWKLFQSFTIPGAAATDYAGYAAALSGDFAAVTNETKQQVVLLHRMASGQWVHFRTIGKAELKGASSSVGRQLALDRNMLLIGDANATPVGPASGAVYVFRREGADWTQAPCILRYHPSALALHAGWAAFCGEYRGVGPKPTLLDFYHVEPGANHDPLFTSPHPTVIVTDRQTEINISVIDPDGNDGLVIDAFHVPEGLVLVDHGNGSASVVGTPTGEAGTSTTLQLRVTDVRGGSSLQTTMVRLISAQDIPEIIKNPHDLSTSKRREIKLTGEVDGEGPFQWQWQKDENDIPGAHGPEMIIPDALTSDGGRYRFIVSNAAGQVTSNTVDVKVRAAGRSAGDWSTFGNSASRTGFHPAALGSHTFVPSWTSNHAQGIERPAIAEGKAFVSSRQGRYVSAIDLSTGQVVWRRSFNERDNLDPCTYHNGRIYVQQQDDYPVMEGRLWVLDANTGSIIWDVANKQGLSHYEAPAVTDDGVWILGNYSGGGLLGGYGSGGDTLFQDAWTSSMLLLQTPAVANRRVFVGAGSAFRELSPEKGIPLWGASSGEHHTTPAISANRAVVGTRTGIACFDLEARSLAWTTDFVAYSPMDSANVPAIKDGIVYTFYEDELIACSLATGGVLWRKTSIDGADFSSRQPLLLIDHLVCATPEATYIFNLDSGDLVQTLAGGGSLAYSGGYLLANDSSGKLRAWFCNTAPIAGPSLPSLVDAGDAAEDARLSLANSFINEDPADILTWSIVSNSRPEIFESLEISADTGDLTVIYNPWQSGSSDVVISVADSAGNVTMTTITFTVPYHPAPQLDVSSSITLNRQTGLYEHSIKVTNSGAREIAGFDLTVTGLPEGVCVNNGSACTGGATTVNHRQPLAAGASTTLILEYYAPARGTVLDPKVAVSLVTEPDADPAAAVAGLAVDRCLRQNDGSLLIEFNSAPGALYEVQYSEDATKWRISPVRVRAAGNRVQWIDRGPPRTDSPPSQSPCRFYRVLQVAESD